MYMKFTLSWGDGTLIEVLLLKEFLSCKAGEWYGGYPSTLEDSEVYEVFHSWERSDGWLGAVLEDKGIPDYVKIEEA